MATENDNSTDETLDQEQQGQQDGTPPETGDKKGSQEQAKNEEPVKLPDDHPLVKTLATQKQAIASQKTELAEARAQAAKVTTLEDELKARPTPEALTTLQTRYDRLEGFLQAVGGPLSKALDSRTFTRDLFESDKPIKDLISKFERDNPSATSTALGKAGSALGSGKIDPNELIRIARGK